MNAELLLKSHLSAIDEKHLVKVTFQAKLDRDIATRACAPTDYGDSRRTPKGINYLHFIDLDSPDPKGPHPLRLETYQVIEYEITEETFDPEQLVTWVPNWYVARNWGGAS